MDLLRLTLLIIGLMIVIGVYFRFRSADDDLILWLKDFFSPVNKSKISASNSISENDDLIPVLMPVDDEPGSQDFEELSKIISTRGGFEDYSKHKDSSFSAIDETVENGPESLLIILNIMSPKNHVFSGEGIHAVMTSAGLTHGDHQIYHYLQDSRAVFSIANVIEPGYFELSKIKSLSTPCLAVFMQLPGPLESRRAFENLLEISKRLAKALYGELCDENRNILTNQTISHLKEKVDMYRLKQQSAHRQKYH